MLQIYNVLGLVALIIGILAGIATLWEKAPKIMDWFQAGKKQRLWTWWNLITGKKARILDAYIERLAKQERHSFVDPLVFVRNALSGERFGEYTRDRATDIIKKYRQCVVCGMAGFGKSALLEDLERRCAEDPAWWRSNDQSRAVPIRLEAGRICQHGIDESIRARFFDYDIHLPKNLLQEYRRQHALLLLIDGTDQLTESQRGKLFGALAHERHADPLLSGLSGLVIAVASERLEQAETDLHVLGKLPIVELRELEDCQVEDVIDQEARGRGQQGDDVTNIIRNCGKVAKLTRIPLLLKRLLACQPERQVCFPSWHDFASFTIDPDLETAARNDAAHEHIKHHHRRAALEEFAACFYRQKEEPPPGALSEEQLNGAINRALKNREIEHTFISLALREDLLASRFLDSYASGEFFAFANTYLRDYFAAGYFSRHEDLLEETYRARGNSLCTVLRFWCGISKQPERLLGVVVNEDPVLGIVLLSDLPEPEPPEQLVHKALEGVKARISQLSVPPEDGSPEAIRELDDNLVSISDALAECTRQPERTPESLGGQVLDFLLDTARRRELGSPSFLIAIMALARSYDGEAAAALIDCWRDLDGQERRLTQQEAEWQSQMCLDRDFGLASAGLEAAMIAYYIRNQRAPELDVLTQHKVFLRRQEARSDRKKFVSRFDVVKRIIRAEFVALGNSALGPLQDDFLKRGGDIEQYVRLLEEIGTAKARQMIDAVRRFSVGSRGLA
jgi:hypothetical protein